MYKDVLHNIDQNKLQFTNSIPDMLASIKK